jgi:hypothetical protein
MVHYQGLLTQKIARRTNPDPQRVGNYINCRHRTVTADEAGHTFDEIRLLTGLSPHLVQQHLD